MARLSDRSAGSDAPSHQELNPLLNPLLAENMSRWAEVYFTNPPEKRDEAVLALVRELEREEKQASAPSTAAGMANATNASVAGRAFSEQRRPDFRSCGACGHENPVTHQFCGMCGARVDRDLPEEVRAEEASRENAEPTNGQAGQPREIPFAGIESNHSDRDRISQGRLAEEDAGEASYAEAEREKPEPVFNSPAAGNDSLSLFQSFRSARAEDEDWDYEPTRSYTRYYIAALLVMIIGGLSYMAWRGSQNAASSHGASPPPPAPVTETAPSTPATTPSTPSPAPSNPEETAAAKNAAPGATPALSPTNVAASHNSEPAKVQTARKTAVPTPDEAAQSTNKLSAGGAEELATAQRYLSGTGGQARDSGEAAQWLWKSVAKHNGQAILLLADLYLRGDGVAKNCEQGRVLLDSAAQKGVAGAGERLRNLQAFGCH